MAYTALDDADIEVGKPVKKKILTQVKTNEEDHEVRLDRMEQGAGKILVCDFEIVGYISHYDSSELKAVATHRAPADFNLVEFVLTIMDSPNGFDVGGATQATGSTGTIQFDLLKSTDGGANFASILSQKPTIPSGLTGRGVSSNSVGATPAIFTDNFIQQDDMLRVDMVIKRPAQGTIHILCYGTLD